MKYSTRLFKKKMTDMTNSGYRFLFCIFSVIALTFYLNCTQPDRSDPEDKKPFIPPTLVKTQNDTIFRCLATDADSTYLGRGQWSVTYTTIIDTSFIDSFQILESVVTSHEFKKLVQKARKLPDFVLSISDSLPVDFIGLRLAIVYCNELSVAMGLVPFYDLPEDTTWYSDNILGENPASNGMRIPTRDELAIARKQLALTNGSFYFRDTLCQLPPRYGRLSCCNDTFYYFSKQTLCSGIWTSGRIDFCSTGTCGDWPFPDCLISNVHLICVKNKPKV